MNLPKILGYKIGKSRESLKSKWEGSPSSCGPHPVAAPGAPLQSPV